MRNCCLLCVVSLSASTCLPTGTGLSSWILIRAAWCSVMLPFGSERWLGGHSRALSEAGPSMHRFMRGRLVFLAKAPCFRNASIVLRTSLSAEECRQFPELVRCRVPARSVMVHVAHSLPWRHAACPPSIQPSDRAREVAKRKPPSGDASEFNSTSTTALAGISSPPLDTRVPCTRQFRRPTGWF
jgi:hypothetical protein